MEILEYLLDGMEDDLHVQLDFPEDGIRSETDYKLMEEELKPNPKKLVGMTVWPNREI